MVNNTTTINKTNNHLSHWTIVYKNTTTYCVGNSAPGLKQAQPYGGVKTLNGIPNPVW